MKTMKLISACILVAILSFGFGFDMSAQRRVTPVQPTPGTKGTPTEKPAAKFDRRNLQEQKDAQGNIIFIDTVTGQEWVDTLAAKASSKKMIYPRFYNVAVGLNIWDPVMRILGQDYGVISAWGELNMHNRFFPTFEIGLGSASIKPEVMNYTYKSSLAPFFKIGANYNLFYNSDPRYKFLIGLRYGFSPFSYKVTDITVNDSYWGEHSTFGIPSQSVTAGYLEFLAGVRVNIVSNFSIGWDIRFRSILHESAAKYGEPMYIPGYGKRGSGLSGSLSIIYTLPLNISSSSEVKNTIPEINNQNTSSK